MNNFKYVNNAIIPGKIFMEPSDYYDAPIDKVLHLIRGVGLIKG
jgi:hypothetical protein